MSASEGIANSSPGAASLRRLMGARKPGDLTRYSSTPAAIVWRGADKGAALKSDRITDSTDDFMPCLACSSDRIFATDPAPPALEKLTWTMDSDTSLR